MAGLQQAFAAARQAHLEAVASRKRKLEAEAAVRAGRNGELLLAIRADAEFLRELDVVLIDPRTGVDISTNGTCEDGLAIYGYVQRRHRQMLLANVGYDPTKDAYCGVPNNGAGDPTSDDTQLKWFSGVDDCIKWLGGYLYELRDDELAEWDVG